MAGISALVGSIKTLANTGSEIIEMSSHFEQTRKSLESLLQSADKGKALFEDLRKFSFETTFGVDELASASSQLINAGVATKDLRAQLKMLGDVAQGDKNKFAELTSVFAKVQLMGKAGAQTISQFNIRGVPLNKKLKEMGVVGTASAKQVTEALEKLTGVGGQFHDAMNNIIDTIEGKRGFIDDTLKEIKVNLGEVTGLTQAYKASLDAMYEVYDKINNKLMEWNKNPVMQAIIRGTIVGGITAIGLAITTAVIPALIKTIAQLQIIATLKAMINPTGLLVGLGISAVVGLGMAVKTVADNEKTVNDELIEQIRLRQTLGEIPLTATTDEKSDYLKTMEEQLKQYQQLQQTSAQKYTSGIFEGYFDTLAQYEKLIKEAEDKLAGFESRGIKKGSVVTQMNADGKIERVDTRTQEQKELEKTEQDLRRLKKTYDDLKKSYETNLYYKSLQKNIEGLTKEIELQKELEATTKKLNDYSPWASQEQGIKELQTQLEEINKMYEQVGIKSKTLDESTGEFKYEYDLEIKINPSYKERLDEVKEALQKELGEAEIKLKISKMKDWQKVLKDSMGFTDKEFAEGFVTSGAVAIDKFKEKLANMNTASQDFNAKGIINIDNLELAKNKLDAINAVLSAIQQSGLWKSNEGTVDELKTMQLSAQDDLYKAQIESLEKQYNLEQMITREKQIQQLVDSGMSREYAEQTVALQEKTMMQTDFWGGVQQKAEGFFHDLGFGNESAKALAKSFTEIGQISLESLASSCEAIGSALAKGADVGEAMKQQFASFMSQVMKSISTTCIQAGLSLIAQSGWAGVPPALALFALGGASSLASGFIGSINEGSSEQNEQEKQLELLKSLNEQYKDLQEAMREQEEYYIKKKHELNMYALDDRTTSVNDMVITPNGKFSTHPDDYIFAMKNPNSLNGGRVTNNIKVINNAGVDVDVSEKQDKNGMNEILVTLSKKIANDVANGYNGWDSAFAMQKQRVDGRRI